MPKLDLPRLTTTDIVAGISVALVLIPQSLAYAELAQLPPYLGLFAAAFPLLVFALLASSPYLQTGPVALTSLFTLSALPDAPASELPKLGGMLALMVGLMRLVLGVGRLGRVVRLMSSPVVMGFTSGAAIVIMATQLPKALGAPAQGDGVIPDAFWAATHVGQWQAAAVGLSVATIVFFIGGRLISPLFPGVLIAVIVGIVFSKTRDYEGATVGDIPEGLPPFSLDLPWDQIPTLLLGAVIIAVVGFAEPASIARTFANETGERWSADRELVASGCANVVAAISGGYPIGGSFSRSSVNRLAGAKTRWSGGITGLVVLAFLPFASVLEPLPSAVLGAIVLGAIATLIKPRQLLRLWTRSRSQALLAWATFAATLLFTPRVERAVLLGVVLTIGLHFGRRFSMSHAKDEAKIVTVKPVGMLWMGTDAMFAEGLRKAVDDSDGPVTIDFAHTPFIDDVAVDAMASIAAEMSDRGHRLEWCNEPYSSLRLLATIHGDDPLDDEEADSDPPKMSHE